MMKLYKAVHGQENKCKELHKEMNMKWADQTGSAGFLLVG